MQFGKTFIALFLTACFYPVISYADTTVEEMRGGDNGSELASDLDLEDARFRFLIWVGEPRNSLRRLDKELARDPDSLELQIIKTDMDFRLGRKLAAYDRISKLIRRAPDHPTAKHLYDVIKASMSSSVSVWWDFVRPAAHSFERSKKMKIEHMLYPNQRLGVQAEQVDLATPAVVDSSSGRNQKVDRSRSVVELSYQYLDMSGDEVGGELLVQTHYLGLKGSYKRWQPWGHHLLSAMTNQPYFGTREAVANEYRRSGLLYETDYYIGYDLQSHWGLGIYRYHSKNIGTVAKSIWYYLGLDYKVPDRFTEKYLKEYQVNVHYSVKGELYSELTQIDTPSGGHYIPFSTKNREVHSLTAEIPWPANNDQYIVAPFLGGATNTHGVEGMVYGVNATYHVGVTYDIGLTVSHDFVGDNNYIGNGIAMTASARF